MQAKLPSSLSLGGDTRTIAGRRRMEESLLIKEKEWQWQWDLDGDVEERPREQFTCTLLKGEMKKISCLGGPMVGVLLSQYLIQVISMMMVGHLGQLSLSSAAIATSFTTAIGFSLLLGMASALETLCGQAYGAKQYHKLGLHTAAAIISLTLVAIPLSLTWIFMGKLLMFFGQDPLIAQGAAQYATWLIPALFAYAILQPLMRLLQSQSLPLPMLATSFTTLCLHLPLCWVLVYKSGLENVGAALASSISTWLNVLLLATYVKYYNLSCEGIRLPALEEVFQGVGEFFRLAVPSAVMICLEWWSFEVLILLSGLLPNPELETSVLSVCLTSISLLYTIPSGLGSAASTRVSNELGADKPQAARLAVYTIVFIAIINAVILCTILFAARNILGYAFSNEIDVVNYVTKMVPLICVSVAMDSVQGVLSGVSRGCGRQHLGAYVNLAAFYFAGLPVAGLLGFYFKLRGRGLWIGIATGSTVQAVLLFIITSCTNWRKQSKEARERVFERVLSIEDGLGFQ